MKPTYLKPTVLFDAFLTKATCLKQRQNIEMIKVKKTQNGFTSVKKYTTTMVYVGNTETYLLQMTILAKFGDEKRQNLLGKKCTELYQLVLYLHCK